MVNIDAVIESLPTIPETKRAVWATNAARILARGPRRNSAYADALRLAEVIAAFEATRPAEDNLIAAYGLDWDRAIRDRTTYRGFDGHRLVALVTRTEPGTFIAQAGDAALPGRFSTLSAARAAAAAASHSREDDTRIARPKVA